MLGTFAAAGVTLAAYKFFNIRVTPKFQKIVIIATIAFAVAMLLNFLLSLAGVNLGLRDDGTGPVSLLAIGVSLLGVVLAVLNLVLDFDYIEKGVAMGAPAKRVLARRVRPDRHDGLALHRDPAHAVLPAQVGSHQ